LDYYFYRGAVKDRFVDTDNTLLVRQMRCSGATRCNFSLAHSRVLFLHGRIFVTWNRRELSIRCVHSFYLYDKKRYEIVRRLPMNYHSLCWSSTSEWSIECSFHYQSRWHNLSGAIELIAFVWVTLLLVVFISDMLRIRNPDLLINANHEVERRDRFNNVATQLSLHIWLRNARQGFCFDVITGMYPVTGNFSKKKVEFVTMILSFRWDFSWASLYLNSLVQMDERKFYRHADIYWQRPHVFTRYIPKRDIYSMADMWLDFRLGVYRLARATGLYHVDAKTNRLDIAILYIQTARRSLSVLILILLSKRSSIINGSALLALGVTVLPFSAKAELFLLSRSCKWNEDRAN
jgi:hypothetical protein